MHFDPAFSASLLRISCGHRRTHRSVKSLYSHRKWVDDLDIVNELGGHTGCVNALSWSTGGNLLASGSDDTYLNIWEYNPSGVAKPFTLNTSVSTGHRANIFSVKFMPHSGDRTVVTCAADSEVRVFDLEYGGADRNYENTTANTRSRRFSNFFPNARWLSEANTNARVYRSHSDRVKRIVTEFSPHLFLTCSEDGEVRQWDLRQPSSAYPLHADNNSNNVPPPLISYRKFDLDLHSISCSSSQPHYIALGGNHLHCFLHDRRMLGRDISTERGDPGSSIPEPGSGADDLMREATKCVRRFAPNNMREMRPLSPAHITACKISDARPNDLIASWSGDHIYSFDIVKDPDATDADREHDNADQESRLQDRVERKRKRVANGDATSSSLGEMSASNRMLRRFTDETLQEEHTAIRVRRGDDEIEDIPANQNPEAAASLSDDELLTEAQRQAQMVAKAVVRLRKTLFELQASTNTDNVTGVDTSSELTPYTSQFTNALGQACVLLPEMEEIISSWSYPLNPTPEVVDLQNALRKNRESAWYFVQAAGVLSKILGGQLRTAGGGPDPRLEKFTMVRPAPRERTSPESRFYYEFIKAILLWLDGGADAVLEGFKRPVDRPEASTARFPCDEYDDEVTMPLKLAAMLHTLADEEKPIFDLDANQFLVDEERTVFQSQQQAVNTFGRALTSIELKMHQGTSEPGIYSSGTPKRVMDKGAAARFWGVKVGRSLLMEAAKRVNYAFVQQAFGGKSIPIITNSEPPSEDEELLDAALDILLAAAAESDSETPSGVLSSAVTVPETADTEADAEVGAPPTITPTATGEDAEDEELSIVLEEANDDENEAEDDNERMGSDVEDEDEDGDFERSDSSDNESQQAYYHHHIIYDRQRLRANLNLDVPYISHTKEYKGHCNLRTVKDVNYYGLDDEYVVSGSDDGNFFIWDRKTCKIVNILEGDGEVVNVVQGHPYEPMIACSGIDSTIKIFGPGGNNRERYCAAKGIGIANPGGSVHSSLRLGGIHRRVDSDDDQEQGKDNTGDRQDIDAEEVSVSRHGLRSRRAIHNIYEITAQNEADRQRGIDDTFVTEGMLARFTAAVQRGEFRGVDGQRFGETGDTIVLDQDNCSVM